MDVWILMGGVDYDGHYVLGVYDTADKANDARPDDGSRWPGDDCYYDSYWVEVWPVK